MLYQLRWIWTRLRLFRISSDPKRAQYRVLKRAINSSHAPWTISTSGLDSSEILDLYQSQVGLSGGEPTELSAHENGPPRMLMANIDDEPDQLGLANLDSRGETFASNRTLRRQSKVDVREMATAWMRRFGLFSGSILSFLDVVASLDESTVSNEVTEFEYIQKSLPAFVRQRCVHLMANEIASISDPSQRYLACTILALAEPRVSGILVPQVDQLLHVVDTANEHFDVICDAILEGEFPNEVSFNDPRGFRFRKNAARHRSLVALKTKDSRLTVSDLWPKLNGVICSTSKSGSSTLLRLRDELPRKARVVEFGQVTGDCVTAINHNPRTNVCIPLLHRNFYEFVERTSWEDGFGVIRTVDQLESGREYYQFISNARGVYRLEINEIFEVIGKYRNTPLLRHVQHGARVVSLVGENLRESELVEAVNNLNSDQDFGILDFVLVGDREKRIYEFYFESNKNLDLEWGSFSLDRNLSKHNPAWATKRHAEKLDVPHMHRVRGGTLNRYRAASEAEVGQKSTFAKSRLEYRDRLNFDIDSAVQWS